MRKKHILWFLYCLLVMKYYLVTSEAGVKVGEKEEAAIPVTTLSPPEGNTTFLGGTTWCVAHAGVAQIDLQNALDWACGLGSADCRPIQDGGPCFQPNNLVAHASFAFNNFYQQNGNSDVACNFGGTAILTKHDPSYEKCMFSSPGSVHSLATRRFMHFASSIMWNGLAWILLLLYLGR